MAPKSLDFTSFCVHSKHLLWDSLLWSRAQEVWEGDLLLPRRHPRTSRTAHLAPQHMFITLKKHHEPTSCASQVLCHPIPRHWIEAWFGHLDRNTRVC